MGMGDFVVAKAVLVGKEALPSCICAVNGQESCTNGLSGLLRWASPMTQGFSHGFLDFPTGMGMGRPILLKLIPISIPLVFLWIYPQGLPIPLL